MSIIYLFISSVAIASLGNLQRVTRNQNENKIFYNHQGYTEFRSLGSNADKNIYWNLKTNKLSVQYKIDENQKKIEIRINKKQDKYLYKAHFLIQNKDIKIISGYRRLLRKNYNIKRYQFVKYLPNDCDKKENNGNST
jgi:hypothetical protein